MERTGVCEKDLLTTVVGSLVSEDVYILLVALSVLVVVRPVFILDRDVE